MSAALPPGWHIALTGGDEIVVRGPEDGPGSMTLPSDVEQGSLPVRLLNALCRAMLADGLAPPQAAAKDLQYDDSPQHDAMLQRAKSAGFRYDGHGNWDGSLTTNELLALMTPDPAPPQAVDAALHDMKARKDGAYFERNQVVAALATCFPSGIARTAIEGWSEDWHGCVYIDLPTGQVSWHFHDSQAHLFDGLPPYAGAWDGHDTPEKYRRLAALRAVGAGSRDREGDAAMLDWLSTQCVTVRTPMRYGSKECFSGSPDTESPSWNIRAAIDAARGKA